MERGAALRDRAKDLRRSEIKRLQATRLARIETLARLSPQRFEDAIAELFRRQGYKVEQTPYTNDHGRDAIMSKNGETYLLECKRYDMSRAIGRRDLQIFHSAIETERAKGGYFVTTGECKKTATDFAGAHRIELIDRDGLAALAATAFGSGSNADLYEVLCKECGETVRHSVLNPDKERRCTKGHLVPPTITTAVLNKDNDSPPNCARCGTPMRLVHGYKGRFWGCSQYPKCQSTKRYTGSASE